MRVFLYEVKGKREWRENKRKRNKRKRERREEVERIKEGKREKDINKKQLGASKSFHKYDI